MEEQSRHTRYRKKRLRKGRLLFVVVFLFLLSIIGYSYVQYNKGKELASDNKIEVEGFEPDDNHPTIENVLIIGVDTRGEEKSRSDTMMLLSWNQKTNDIKLVSFMRDIYADIPGYQSYKLNTAYYLDGVPLQIGRASCRERW